MSASILAAFGAGISDGLTFRAHIMWRRAILDPRLTRLVAGACFGVENMGDLPTLRQKGEARAAVPLTSWPGWQGLPGVARARFDGKGGWEEQPMDSVGDGRLVVTLPVGAIDDGVFTCTDIIACDPLMPHIWARLTKQAELMGEAELQLATTYAANDEGRPLRLHRTPLGWWRAGNGVMGRGTGCCILSPRAWRWDEVLRMGWICDDEAHAVETAERQKRARAALTSERVPQAGELAFVMRGAA